MQCDLGSSHSGVGENSSLAGVTPRLSVKQSTLCSPREDLNPCINAVYALPTSSFKIHFNVILPSTLRSSKWSTSCFLAWITVSIPYVSPVKSFQTDVFVGRRLYFSAKQSYRTFYFREGLVVVCAYGTPESATYRGRNNRVKPVCNGIPVRWTCPVSEGYWLSARWSPDFLKGSN